MSSIITPSARLIERNKIVLLGDSITQLSFSASLSGWGANLADVYQRRCDVYNRGMSGYNTEWFLKYINTPVGKYDVFESLTSSKSTANSLKGYSSNSDVKLVTIFFGANDASSKDENPRHYVPTNRFEKNLKEIIRLCRFYYGETVRIILITPPPVHNESRLKFQIQKYGNQASGKLERSLELSRLYSEVVVKVANEMSLVCLNLWTSMQKALPGANEPWSVFFIDGLHFSKEGNLFVGEKLIETINTNFPDIAVTPCPSTNYTGNSSSKGGSGLGSEFGVGPWHDEIDYLDSNAAFDHICCSKK